MLKKAKPDNYQFKGTVSSGRSSIDIRVAPANVSRSLRFLDTLFKAIEARGYSVEIRNGSTVAVTGDDDFKMIFREKMKKVIENNGHWDHQFFVPTGILAFQVDGYYGREWKDGGKPLEDHLAAIIAHLELSAEERRKWQMEWKRKEEEEREKERLLAEQAARRKQEVTDFRSLLNDSERWHKAENLRRYIDAIEQKANDDSALKKWLTWAKKKADWYDPFIQADDEWMQGVERNTVRSKKSE